GRLLPHSLRDKERAQNSIVVATMELPAPDAADEQEIKPLRLFQIPAPTSPNRPATLLQLLDRSSRFDVRAASSLSLDQVYLFHAKPRLVVTTTL
ncbi:hypothetical protein PSTT_09514, partial [Puccinia striiformis]